MMLVGLSENFGAQYQLAVWGFEVLCERGEIGVGLVGALHYTMQYDVILYLYNCRYYTLLYHATTYDDILYETITYHNAL